MANTLNLGNGNWATKEDSLLAYNSENGNFKPLPFDFTRASSATVVNKAGLIETVGSGEPRIDFKDDAKGALLLEPTRTNKVPYSEAFDNAYWIKADATVVGGYSAPDGSNNAFKLIEGTSNSQHSVRSGFIATTNGSEIASSIFVKADTRSVVTFQESAYTGVYLTIDLISETITTNVTSANLTKLANGWFRIDIVSTCNVVTSWKVMPSLNGTTTYQGDGTSGIYIWGFQLEDNVSYATSYIPNFGNSAGATRSADACTGAGNDQVINSTEGVLYAEISALDNDGTSRYIAMTDNTGSNEIIIQYNSTANRIGAYMYINGTGYVSNLGYVVTDVTDFHKVAFKWAVNDFSLWIDGVERATDISGATFVPNVLTRLDFGAGPNGGSLSFYGNTKDVKLYNTALTDSELTALTKI